MSQRMVVVGGGAAGMSAASAARRVDPALEVVVLEASGDIAYGMCGLPYFLSGVVAEPDELLAYPLGTFTSNRGIDVRLHARALAVDPSAKTVTYEQGGLTKEIEYSSLVVTAGATPVEIPIRGLDTDRVYTVRSLEEAIELRAVLDAGVSRALVIGAGYIGLEMAEALAERGCTVTVVERLSQVLPTLDVEVAGVVEAHVREYVDLRLNTDVAEIDTNEFDIAVVSVGVRPASTMAAAAGAATGPSGALLVDPQMRTTIDGVWAAGDCIAPLHRVTGSPAFIPLGTTANKTGRVAGTVAAGGPASFEGIVGTAVVKVFDLEVARTGLTLREAEAAGFSAGATDVVHRSRAKYYPGGNPVHIRLVHADHGRLLGAQIVAREGAAQRINVIATALYAELQLSDLAALDLAYAPPYSPVYDPILIAAASALRGKDAT